MNNDRFINYFGTTSTSLASKWFISNFFAIPRFAHHPTCKCYNHHLIRFNSYSFCLGCFSLGTGAILCIALAVLAYILEPTQVKGLNPWLVICIGNLLTTLTFIQPFFQKKWFKILSRASLGFGITALWLGSMCLLSWDSQGLILRCVFILVFLLMFKLSLQFRNNYTTKTVCNCGSNAYPYCPENQTRIKKLLKYYIKMASHKNDPMFPIIQGIAKAQEFNNFISLEDNISTLTIEK